MEKGAERVRATRSRARRSIIPCLPTTLSARADLLASTRCRFHMSGTEAVMQAGAAWPRYHTPLASGAVLRAYHGWWEMCSRASAIRCWRAKPHTLKEMSEDTLRVLRRRRDIACVLANPLQALHPRCAGAGATPGAGGQLAQRCSSIASAHSAWLCGIACGVRCAGHSAHFRRGVRRLPASSGRGAGLFRRARRPRYVWQRRWAAACRSGWSAAAAIS